MRSVRTLATLSLALLPGACSKRSEPTANLSDDLKKDLAAASVASSDFATAPANYQRMRFVSDVEMARKSVPAKRPKVSPHPDRMAPANGDGVESSNAKLQQVAAMSSHAPTPVATAEAAAPAPSIEIAASPTQEPPMTMPAGSSAGGGAEHEHGGGLGGILGGIIGGVVIRGGHGGPDKCDPRTDGRARGTINARPDFGLPVPTGAPTFPGRGRHVYH